MLSNLAMRASRVTVRLPSDLSRLGRARVAPATAKPHAMRRVAAFAKSEKNFSDFGVRWREVA